MTRRHVLVALGQGIAAGDDDVARAALGRIDWVLRRPAKRRLERALIDAALANLDVGVGDVDGVRHVQRVAALDVARHRGIDAADREAVAAAYAKLPVPTLGRAPIATIVAGLVALALASAAVAIVWSLPGSASRAYARPLPPPAVGAFKTGGVPLPDAAMEALLVGNFTDYVLEVDADRRSFGMRSAQRTAAATALRSAPAFAAHPALQAAWVELIGVFDRWVTLPISSPEFQTVATAIRTRARVVSDQLAAAGIGYYLEGSVFGSGDAAHAVVYTYRVEEVVFVSAGDKPRRVLSLRRLDNINLVHTLLGMESLELGDPILLLDQIEQHVATHVMPTLAATAPFPLADPLWEDPAKLGSAAGDAVRREMAAALGPDAKVAIQIADLLAERATLVEGWRDSFEKRNLRLAHTKGLFLPDGMLDQLAGHVPGRERERAAAIDETLATLEAPRIASRCQELLARTVRHHEAQHGLDADRGSPLPYPDALAAYVGDFENHRGEARPAAEHANAELSAYTSQLANDQVTPQLTLWSTAQHAFTKYGWGTTESYVAVLVLDGIARHLGGGAHAPVIHDGMIDRTRLAAIVSTLPARSGGELRTAARELWQEFYGEPLVAITDR